MSKERRTRIDACCPTEYWFSLASRLIKVRVWLSGLRPASTKLRERFVDVLDGVLGDERMDMPSHHVDVCEAAHGVVPV